MKKKEKWIVGNWKMKGTALSCRDLAGELEVLHQKMPLSVKLAVCPPAPYLGLVGLRLMGTSLLLGGQDCSAHLEGAFTGQVSAAMLKDLGCSMVILGHSERRTNLKESNDLIRQKAEAALTAGLTPLICVGESLEEREAGKALSTVLAQVRSSVPSKAENGVSLYLIAYEPVWAIGTGKTPEKSQIQEIHDALAQEKPEAFLLYGGSVKSSNAAEILSIPHVDGVLVGGASLQALEFWKIAGGAQEAQEGSSPAEG